MNHCYSIDGQHSQPHLLFQAIHFKTHIIEDNFGAGIIRNSPDVRLQRGHVKMNMMPRETRQEPDRSGTELANLSLARSGSTHHLHDLPKRPLDAHAVFPKDGDDPCLRPDTWDLEVGAIVI